MSGPLHAIMRGQYAQSFQSADERTRNRAAAAVVLGAVLIGGAIYVATSDGTQRLFAEYVKDHSVTKKQAQELNEKTRRIAELETGLSKKKISLQEAREEAKRQLAELNTLKADLQTKAAFLAEAATNVTALTQDVDRSQEIMSAFQRSVEVAQKEAKTSNDRATELSGMLSDVKAELAEANRQLMQLSTAETDKKHATERAALLENEIARINKDLESARAAIESELKEKQSANAKAQTAAANAEESQRRLGEEQRATEHQIKLAAGLKADVERLAKELEQLRKDNVELQRKTAGATDTEKQAKESLEAKQRELDDASAKIGELRDTNRASLKTSKELELRAVNAEDREAQLTAENERLQATVSGFDRREEEFAKLTTEVRRKTMQIGLLGKHLEASWDVNANLQKTADEVARFQAENMMLKTRLDELSTQTLEANRQVGEFSAQVIAMEREKAAVAKLTETVKQISEKLTEYQGAYVEANINADVNAELAKHAEAAARGFAEIAAERLHANVNMGVAADTLLTDFTHRLAAHYGALSTCMNELTRVGSRNAGLDEANKLLTKENEKLRQKLDDAENKKIEAVSSAKEDVEKYSKETRDRLEAQVKNLEDDLRKERIRIDSMAERHKKKSDHLIKAESEQRTAKEGLEQQNQTLRSEVENLNKKWSAAVEQNGSHMKTKAVDDEKLRNLDAELTRRDNYITKLSGEVEDAQRQKAVLDEQLRSVEVALRTAQGSQAAHKSSEEKAAKNVQTLEDELTRVRDAANERNRYIGKLEGALAAEQAAVVNAKQAKADQEEENARLIKRWEALTEIMNFAIGVLNDPVNLATDAGGTKASFDALINQMGASGFFPDGTNDAAVLLVNESIQTAILGAKTIQSNADVVYGAQLANLHNALNEAANVNSGLAEQMQGAQGEFDKHAHAAVTQLHAAAQAQEALNATTAALQAEAEALRGQLTSSRNETDDLRRQLVAVRDGTASAEQLVSETTMNVLQQTLSLALSLEESNVRDEINLIAANHGYVLGDNGMPKVDEYGQRRYLFQMDHDDELRDFLTRGKFCRVDLLLDLRTRLTERKMTKMAERFINVVRSICEIDDDNHVPAFTCDASGMQALDAWAKSEISGMLRRVKKLRKGGAPYERQNPLGSYVGKAMFGRGKAKRRGANGMGANGDGHRDEAEHTDRMSAAAWPAVEAVSSAPLWGYAMRQYLEAQRMVLACVLTAARANAIIRLARSAGFGAQEARPRVARKRAFV
jgi:chromosome segregation ATPase